MSPSEAPPSSLQGKHEEAAPESEAVLRARFLVLNLAVFGRNDLRFALNYSVVFIKIQSEELYVYFLLSQF